MESDWAAVAAVEWRRKEQREAAQRTEKMEVVKEARGYGGVERGGAEAEEELADGAGGDGYRWEEGGAIGREGRRQEHRWRPVAAGYRAPWRERAWGWRGGRGGGGFQFHRRPWYGAMNIWHHKSNISNNPGVYGGAIIICNRLTKRQFFHQKIFALPGYAATFIQKIRAGMLLFLFELEERKLYGVFEATSDGAMNILPDACASVWKSRPAQVLFRRVWFCKPLIEAEFSDIIKGNCLHTQMSFFGISYQQVLNLVDIFSSRLIRLEPYQKPKSRVLWDYKISLARTGQEFSLHTPSDACFGRSSSMFGNNRISLAESPFMYAKHNGKHTAHKHESPLPPWPKPVVFKAPDIKEKSKPDADYIPLELGDLDDCKSDSDADQSTLLAPVSFHSTLESSISYEDQVPKPTFNGKHNEDDRYRSPALNRRLISESKTGRNSVIAHIMKENKSSLQAKGCKRKATVQFDEISDVLSPRRGCSVAKKVSFSFGGNEISVTSDKALHKPALAEKREAGVEQGKEEIVFSPQHIQKKERDVSAKRSKLMSLSFAEQLRNQRAQSCSRNSSHW